VGEHADGRVRRVGQRGDVEADGHRQRRTERA
jgi:hypothetical protein